MLSNSRPLCRSTPAMNSPTGSATAAAFDSPVAFAPPPATVASSPCPSSSSSSSPPSFFFFFFFFFLPSGLSRLLEQAATLTSTSVEFDMTTVCKIGLKFKETQCQAVQEKEPCSHRPVDTAGRVRRSRHHRLREEH